MISPNFFVSALKQLIPNKSFYYVGDIVNEKSFYEKFNVIVGSDEIGSAILSNNRDDFGITWEQVSDKIAELKDAEPMRLLREERNRKIVETDWWVLPDRSASQEQKDYRQALRDLPSTASPKLDDDGNLTNVTWPTKPS
tara:strand:- start:47 stop:466 length:420 start_codon:yes stop_codon:yes gene_type:complete